MKFPHRVKLYIALVIIKSNIYTENEDKNLILTLMRSNVHLKHNFQSINLSNIQIF